MTSRRIQSREKRLSLQLHELQQLQHYIFGARSNELASVPEVITNSSSHGKLAKADVSSSDEGPATHRPRRKAYQDRLGSAVVRPPTSSSPIQCRSWGGSSDERENATNPRDRKRGTVLSSGGIESSGRPPRNRLPSVSSGDTSDSPVDDVTEALNRAMILNPESKGLSEKRSSHREEDIFGKLRKASSLPEIANPAILLDSTEVRAAIISREQRRPVTPHIIVSEVLSDSSNDSCDGALGPPGNIQQILARRVNKAPSRRKPVVVVSTPGKYRSSPSSWESQDNFTSIGIPKSTPQLVSATQSSVRKLDYEPENTVTRRPYLDISRSRGDEQSQPVQRSQSMQQKYSRNPRKRWSQSFVVRSPENLGLAYESNLCQHQTPANAGLSTVSFAAFSDNRLHAADIQGAKSLPDLCSEAVKPGKGAPAARLSDRHLKIPTVIRVQRRTRANPPLAMKHKVGALA